MSIEGEIRRSIDIAMPGTNQHRGASELMHWYKGVSKNFIDLPELTDEQRQELQKKGVGPIEHEIGRLLKSPYSEWSYPASNFVVLRNALKIVKEKWGFEDTTY